jgi:hypothetical protein
MTKQTLNYEILLDDWKIDLKAKIAKCDNMLKRLDPESYRYGYYKGICEGYKVALAKVEFLEGPQKNAKYLN